MINKKGFSPVNLVWAVLLGIIILVVISGGGLSTIYNITKFLGKIPTFIWVIIGVVFVFKMFGGKKR